ncbi:MAG: hypothetical protein JRJ86_23395 [Deltaproteobacteria bacterium]|nr:hypothetical protein [Deltaproteobacteria bacterium]MBW2117460.1 hypothetical protein [Deltaproteobacteria bacterium]MBW2345959.1 hypothetical protein [Deltaproteobacteria bacterium]
MRINKLTFTLVTTLLIGLVFCGPAQSEEYEAVSPSELSFGLAGFRSEAKAEKGEAETKEGGVRILNGTFEKFICEDTEIEVVEKKIKGGMIETRDYGKIRVSIDSSGGLAVYVMPSQKKKLIENTRK